MEKNLKDIADKAKKDHLENDGQLEEVQESKKVPSEDFVIHGIGGSPIPENIEEITEIESIENSNFSIDTEDLMAVMPDLDQIEFAKAVVSITSELTEYRKNLIINNGFTVQEAEAAVRSRLALKGKEINDEYLENNPKLGIIEINKKDVDKIELSPEEREKLTRVKAIKMVVVEDEFLKNIKVEKVKKQHKAAYLRSIEGSLSKYSVPIPIMGDYVSFNGAQIIQLASVVAHEDDTHIETLTKKASLIYDRLSSGTIYSKHDDENKVTMTYQEFVNSFFYNDLDMAMYGVLIASSMEESENTFECSECSIEFQWKYKVRTLLDGDSLGENFKERMGAIISNKYNIEKIQKLHDELSGATRFQSPFSKNIYEISYPTIARATSIFSVVDEADVSELYLSALGIYTNSLYIYDSVKQSYLEIEEDEPHLLMETLRKIPQEDINLLTKIVRDMTYTPKFILKTQCPECANKMTNELTIDTMIFLKAHDSITEIE